MVIGRYATLPSMLLAQRPRLTYILIAAYSRSGLDGPNQLGYYTYSYAVYLERHPGEGAVIQSIHMGTGHTFFAAFTDVSCTPVWLPSSIRQAYILLCLHSAWIHKRRLPVWERSIIVNNHLVRPQHYRYWYVPALLLCGYVEFEYISLTIETRPGWRALRIRTFPAPLTYSVLWELCLNSQSV